MDIKKVQMQFEELLRDEAESSGVDAPDLRLSPCVLDDGAVIYVSDIIQACWWVFRKSRELLVIKLPPITHMESEGSDVLMNCAHAIHASGIKTK
jgi:hypothetical protein